MDALEQSTGETETAGPGPIFWWCFALCGAATLLPLWAVEYLPGTDLPQHVAQIALWQQFDAGIGRDTYWINWFTPYLFGYSLVRLVAAVVSIETAFRIVLSVYALALPLGMLAWLRRWCSPNARKKSATGSAHV